MSTIKDKKATSKAKTGTAKTSTPKRKIVKLTNDTVVKDKAVKKTKKKVLDKKNIKTTVKQVVKSNRDIKYKYPTGMDNTLERKAFRQQVRNKYNKLIARLAKLEKAKDPGAITLKAKIEAFRKEHYTVA